MLLPHRPALTVLCACVLLTVACQEQPRRAAPQGLYESTLANFNKADSNNDEQLTREEMTAGLPQFAASFDEIDTDHNGKVNFAELWSFVQYRYVQRDPEHRIQR